MNEVKMKNLIVLKNIKIVIEEVNPRKVNIKENWENEINFQIVQKESF